MFADRKAYSLNEQRRKLPWPKNKDFKILAIDGGGIRGIFPAVFLEEMEQRFGLIRNHFDLVAGTSTGGIIALGIGLGMSCKETADLYRTRGKKIFPPKWYNRKLARFLRRLVRPSHDHQALELILKDVFDNRILGESVTRLVIPAFVGPEPQITIFKTDHHPDYKRDWKSKAWEIARATSAAPTFFEGHASDDAYFLDGGVWANSPIMCAVVEALSAYEIEPKQIRILSLGTGNVAERLKESTLRAGMIGWRGIIKTAMYLTTDSAVSQAKLMLGHHQVVRIEPDAEMGAIEMDDWQTATNELPDLARAAFAASAEDLGTFFRDAVSARERYYSVGV